MLRAILSWLRRRDSVPDIGHLTSSPSFEPLEARVLLSADLAGILPVPSLGAVPADPVIYVNLDEQGVREPTESSPLLSLDAALPSAPTSQDAIELFRVSPALFVENQGQWSDPSIRYVHDGTGFDVAMLDAGVRFRSADADLQLLQFSAAFVGANLVRPTGLERSATVFNYCVGDPAIWRQNVPSYKVVTYEGLYEGVDLCVQGLVSHLKYEFHVAPGADYTQIAVRYEGIDWLSIGADGALEVNLGAGRGVIRDDAPYIYQEIDGQKVEVAGRFVLLDKRTYAFEITGSIDPDHVLVIDPNLAWSTYVGASGYEGGYGIAVDNSGSVYVTGYTTSSDWTNGGFDTSYNGGDDAFVVKLSSSGAHLWSTYLGGSGDDQGNGIAVNGAGNVFVAGTTASAGWTSSGFDTSYNGGDDAFVVKLSSSGAHLWSTYLGGSGSETGKAIATDGSGNVYVTGETASSGWTSGGFDTSYNGGGYYQMDAFAAKLSADGTHLWSTYLGGSNDDGGYGIAVDSSGNVLVTGGTWSASWTSGGWDTSYNSNEDGFVAKLSTDGSHLWSTYLGGDSGDWGNGIAVDVSGNVHVVGSTSSAGWTSGGFNTTFNGSQDPFVIKLSANGAHLWSTYLGGDSGDSGAGIAVDAAGDVFVTGSTWSPGWTSDGWDTSHNGGGDAYAAKLSPEGEYLWSTYLGGDGDDGGNGVALDAWDGVYVVGYTNSVGWTTGGFDTTFHGHDAFVAKLWSVWDVTPPSPNPSTWATEPYATGETSIRMVATTAMDNRGVEYYFDEISGNPGGTDSGWQDSNVYEDTGLSPGTTYIYRVKTRDRSENLNETAYSPALAATTPSPIYRFWSESLSRHFYTIKEGEKNKLLNSFSQVWTYEQVAYYAFPASQPGTSPVYRFWSASLNAHVYTMKPAERDKLLDNYSHVWTYEGMAFYAYAPGAQPTGTMGVYRFWSATLNCHFYTMKVAERDKLINSFSSVWTYEDVMWYAYGA
jgi:hypothetical protein